MRKLTGLLLLALLALVTVRSATRAAFVNFDDATEFLVYAHMASGPKTVMNQIEELSQRITGREDLKIAYDNETTYPFWWYLRNYDQAMYFGTTPSRDLLNYPVVIAGDANWGKLDPLLRDNFFTFDYIRIWWPNQDYFRWRGSDIESEYKSELRAEGQEDPPPMGFGEYLVRFWGKLSPYLFEQESRNAAWQIWFNRDFSAYGTLTNTDYSKNNWNPSNKMRLYIRKDIAAMVWSYGVSEVGFEPEEFIDPYEDLLIPRAADLIVGQSGTLSGEFSQPHGVAVSPDGTIYIADSLNHRIQHLSTDGEVLHMWGRFGSVDQGNADGGTFNEPWGIGIAPDGTVYVADTWNHRVQHFTAEGRYLDMFGSFGQAESPTAFWGPRDVVVDSQGRIFVSDTGNKRVVVFDSLNQPLDEFGGFGLELGGLDEPVGLTLDGEGRVYIADTWNQRIQIFEDFGDANFSAVAEWPISGWYGQSLNNKPYLAIGPDGNVCATDPEGPRILCFDSSGEFTTGWSEDDELGTILSNPTGIAFDTGCGVWISDSNSSRIMHFELDICPD